MSKASKKERKRARALKRAAERAAVMAEAQRMAERARADKLASRGPRLPSAWRTRPLHAGKQQAGKRMARESHKAGPCLMFTADTMDVADILAMLEV